MNEYNENWVESSLQYGMCREYREKTRVTNKTLQNHNKS